MICIVHLGVRASAGFLCLGKELMKSFLQEMSEAYSCEMHKHFFLFGKKIV